MVDVSIHDPAIEIASRVTRDRKTTWIVVTFKDNSQVTFFHKNKALGDRLALAFAELYPAATLDIDGQEYAPIEAAEALQAERESREL